MSQLTKGLKKIPLCSIYGNGVIKPLHVLNPNDYNQPLSSLKQSFNTSNNLQKIEDENNALEPEPELGVTKLFPCDVLQAHWLAEVCAMVPKWITKVQISSSHMKIDTPLQYCKPLLKFLRNHTHCFFQQCDMIGVVDHIGEPLRFELSYGLRNVMYWNVLRVHTFVDELTHVPSVSSIYGSAVCLENKAYDMYGVFFKDHPDLRRIYTDYGFQGHPMRKDFPVTGYTEIRYDDTLRRIVYEPVEMAQELRKFDFLNPWHSDDPRFEKK